MHSLRSQYEKPENEAFILRDAKNAFNCLNRNLAVENIKRICPALSFVVQKEHVLQKWYADNGSAVGRLEDLFFKQLTEPGSYFGYNTNIPKCQLIVNEAPEIKNVRLFEGTAIEINDGCRIQ